MADDDDPRHKDVVISTRVPPEVAEMAKARARKQKRSLGEILRAWLMLFAEEEAPMPPPLDDGRAPQRPSKRKKKNDAKE